MFFNLHFCLEATWVGLLLSWQTPEIVQEFNVAEAFLAAADEINCPQLTSGTSFQSSVCHKKFTKKFYVKFPIFWTRKLQTGDGSPNPPFFGGKS